MIRALIFSLTLILPAAAQVRHPLPPAPFSRIDLNGRWHIQSSAQVSQPAEIVSTTGLNVQSWYPAKIPSTVLAALVDNKLYPDPYFGMNLRSIPGTTYEIGDNFANTPMPADSPFAVSWWYRREFEIPAAAAQRRLWLNFDSINYRANIWLNGRKLGDAAQVAGMYRGFEFDIAGLAAAGTNTLAVEVFPPDVHDLGITFVDWNPLPADKDMGIVRDVYIRMSGPVAVRNAQVVTHISAGLDQASLTVYADVTNASDQPVAGTLEGAAGAIALSKAVGLLPGETATVTFTPATIDHPDLWWPYGLGPQTLQNLHLQFRTAAGISDQQDVQFGIREFTSELDSRNHRVFRVNGKRILIRGGGWTHDMMLRVDPVREESEIRYARDMHLNTLRLEGKMFDEHFFDLADRYGMLVMPGWCCCGWFEQWDNWTATDSTVAAESLRTQLRRLRNHASVFVFLYGSDAAPPPTAEQNYLNVIRQERWPHPYLSAASDNDTLVGRTGVKMKGPYDYVPPNYWLLDTHWGGAWGFNTETSPGHAIPLVPSLEQMLGKDHLWPVDDTWIFHGASVYPVMSVYTNALESRYGKSRDLADFVEKSQAIAYEGERAMFEAFRRNKYTSATGVVQWMLNNAWPSTVWHLYDWYLRPGGGYFGTKKANEPLHVQYSYDDRSIVVTNSLYTAFPGYSVTAKVYNLDLSEQFSQTASVDIAEDSSTRVFTLPPPDGLSRTYFVRLWLRDPDGAVVSSNFYWLSTQDDVVDWAAQTDYWYTPIRTFADLTGLQNLPPAQVTVSSRTEAGGADRIEHVVVRNPSANAAFLVHLTALRDDGSDINPVIWGDNFFELFPGEEREITATYAAPLAGRGAVHIQADGWNFARTAN
jgi:exo-1,4-beta-D-glucosaminidase